MNNYGIEVGSAVKLWMADRRVWTASFSNKDNCIFGLQRWQNYYSIEPESVIVLQYFGKSTFYVCMFGSNGLDVHYGIRDKILVKDVIIERHGKFFSIFQTTNTIAIMNFFLISVNVT